MRMTVACRSWEVLVHRSVRKFEKKHPSYKHVVAEALRALGENPFVGEKLSGSCSGLWRLRKGELRVIYEIDIERDRVEGWPPREHLRGALLVATDPLG